MVLFIVHTSKADVVLLQLVVGAGSGLSAELHSRQVCWKIGLTYSFEGKKQSN